MGVIAFGKHAFALVASGMSEDGTTASGGARRAYAETIGRLIC
jgi:hypothetical protein